MPEARAGAEKAALVGFLEALLEERTQGASRSSTDDNLRMLIEVLAGRAKVSRLGEAKREPEKRSSSGGGGLLDFAESLLDGIDSLGGGKATHCRGGRHAFKCLNCGETVQAKASE